MPETYEVIGSDYKGERPNPHGGVLHKFSVALQDGEGRKHLNVYWQRKSQEAPSGEVYGEITDGEYGPRFRTAQRPDGNFQAPKYERVPNGPDPQAERSRRIERQHSQEMALRWASLVNNGPEDVSLEVIKGWTDWFARDLDGADVGGGIAEPTPRAPAADVSAEASPQQKARLTKEFGKAGLSREAMKAIVLFRCNSEKATRAGASQLITDLIEGATAEALVAEIWDAHRAGNNPVATRASKLLPQDVPVDTEGLPELDEPAKDDDTVPF